jgi:3-oxosteroid 1-dehydrogenase
MTEQIATDVIIVGSGLGGLATALTARVLGLRPLILEKDSLVGGGSSWSMGALWVGCNALAGEAGIFDQHADVMKYMEAIAGGEGDSTRVRALVDAAPGALDFFRECGIPFRLVRGLGDHWYGKLPGSMPHGRTLETETFSGASLGAWRTLLRTPEGSAWRFPLSQDATATQGLNSCCRAALLERAIARDELHLGVGLVAHFLHQLITRGVSIETNAGVASIIQDGGRVVGVTTHDGRRFEARCGVVLATGGYESNDVMASQFEGLPGHRSMFHDSITGDGMKLGIQAGAAVWRIHNSLMVMLGVAPDGGSESGAFRPMSNSELPNPHSIIVNRRGQRFGDESSFQMLAPALREYDPTLRRHRNLPCWFVFDQQYVDKFGIVGQPGAHVPEWVESADQLSSLARRLGVDPDGLTATVATFNEHASHGVDRDYGRGSALWSLIQPQGAGPNPCLGTIECSPFYAIELSPSAMSSAGLKADAQGRVLDSSDRPIPGLYAVGNAAAHTEYGVGYQAGHALTSAMTFAFLAAHDMRLSYTPKQETQMTTIYTATATSTGGREGRSRSSDGKLDVALSMPKEFGGTGGPGTNPEQLFAAGYSACFESVLRLIARQQKKSLTNATVTAHVHVHPLTQGFGLSAGLEVKLDGVTKSEAEELVRIAHTMCPYSNATRGNIEVKTTVL